MPDMWMDVDQALTEVPVNIMPLIDDTDFKTREESVAYDAAGMDLQWNFVDTAGTFTQTVVTPTTGGDYDWAHQGNGMYSIEMTASGGASADNDTEGVGWFTGVVTGVLPWRGPTIGFRDSDLNDLLIDTAFSATRGLAGTALPDAVADAAGGLPISDAGGLDLDTSLGSITGLTPLSSGTAQAGAASTITLAAGESATNDIYNGQRIALVGGTGTGQSKMIFDYNNSTKVVTIVDTWAVNPAGDTLYEIHAANVNLEAIFKDLQKATDLGDFATDGYDPATNQVEGVKTVDTTTTNSDMVAEAPTAAANANEWESQSQADPTGFHVNVLEMLGDGQSVTDLKDFADAGYDPATDKVTGVKLVDANTDVRGTDNAALASVLGALADAAAAGDPTSADTVMQYVKQLINVLIGTTGIGTYPPEQAPANGVNLAEVLRAVHADVTGLNGSAMIGTNSAALAANYTAARAGYLDNINGHTPQTGDNFPRLGAPAGASVSADIAAVPTASEILSTQLADAVSADGTIPTVQQALYEIVQYLEERSVSGTTVTVRKQDGSTGLMTFTLSDASDPTSITRST